MNRDTKSLQKEIWKDIPEYEGLYQVSNLGRVKRLSYILNNISGSHHIAERVKKPTINTAGYFSISLYKDNKRKTFLLHRLIADAFVPNPHNKPCVNHINHNKQDFSLSNLEWVTQGENLKYSWEYNNRTCWMTNLTGKNNHNSKSVIQYDVEMNPIRIWDCISDIERELGYSNSSIVAHLKGRSKVSHGFKWRYHV